MGTLTVTAAEEKVVQDRLAELGLETVKNLAAIDGFPTTHRLLVLQWIARGGKAPEENANE